MERINIDKLLQEIKACIDRHNLGKPGHYCRWTAGDRRDYTINEYGVADAANILYTIGEFSDAMEHRADWIRVLQDMQDPETGMYHEKTHYPPPYHRSLHRRAGAV